MSSKRDWSDYASCPVCLDLYDETDRAPKCLHCGHTVCKNCAKQLASTQQRYNTVSIQCPECRQNHTYADLSSVDQLPTNVSLKSLIGLLKLEGARGGAQKATSFSAQKEDNEAKESDVLVSCATQFCPHVVTRGSDSGFLSAHEFWVCTDCAGESYCPTCASIVHADHNKKIYSDYMKQQFAEATNRLNQLSLHVSEADCILKTVDLQNEKYGDLLVAMDALTLSISESKDLAKDIVDPLRNSVAKFARIESDMTMLQSELRGFLNSQDWKLLPKSKALDTLNRARLLFYAADMFPEQGFSEVTALLATCESKVTDAVSKLKVSLNELFPSDHEDQNEDEGEEISGPSIVLAEPTQGDLGEASNSFSEAVTNESDVSRGQFDDHDEPWDEGLPDSLKQSLLFKLYLDSEQRLHGTTPLQFRKRVMAGVNRVMHATGRDFDYCASALLEANLDVERTIRYEHRRNAM